MTQHTARFWFWSLLTIGTVFIITTVPMPESASRILYLDKLAHALFMGLIATVLARRIRPWAAIGAGVVISTVIEFIQFFIPWRSCEVADAVCGSIGSVLAVGLYQWKAYRNWLEHILW